MPSGAISTCIHAGVTGSIPYRELADAARKLGYGYIAVCDHVRSPEIDRGMTEEKIAKQRDEIRDLNREQDDLFIFHGIECNIGPDGSLDLPPAILEDFDLVIAGIHSQTRMHGDEMTRAHPCGSRKRAPGYPQSSDRRILLRRESPEL